MKLYNLANITEENGFLEETRIEFEVWSQIKNFSHIFTENRSGSMRQDRM